MTFNVSIFVYGANIGLTAIILFMSLAQFGYLSYFLKKKIMATCGYKITDQGVMDFVSFAVVGWVDVFTFRMVREWNPATGGKRTWFETLNPNGGVIQVRPVWNSGVKTHYLFNGIGGYLGKW